MRLSQCFLLAVPALVTLVSAEDQPTGAQPSDWPQWITNDYECVIGCLSGFNDTITSVPQDTMANDAFSCTAARCQGDGTGNYYQTLYYIQLFYATGSIYEWADSAPDGYKHATFSSADQPAEASASSAIATESSPWTVSSAAGGEAGGNVGAATAGSDGIAQSTEAPLTTGSGTESHTASPAKSASSSIHATSATAALKSVNPTTTGNASSAALSVFADVSGAQCMLGVSLIALVATSGVVWLGL
ncbi:hypothetical protein IAU60_003872 [Kwoniella sp. DSM 27419]